MMVRKPAVAGQFYPARKESLENNIVECFTHELGPGKVPESKDRTKKIQGVVAPHAGYVFSGPVAAHSYSALYRNSEPDVAVIIGPAHSGFGAAKAAVADQDFETPLGVMEVDTELGEAVTKGPIVSDNRLHQGEHSIEVQLPFLQYLFKDLKILPILISSQDFETASQVGKTVKEEIKDRKAVVIASTDFSHYVTPEVAKRRDKLAIEKILDNDPKGLYSIIRKENISMCGYGPVVSLMFATGYKNAELLKYATSGDIRPMMEVVGYASIACW